MLGVLVALPGIARDFTYEYEGQTLTYTVISEDAKTCMTKSGGNRCNGTSCTYYRGNYITGDLVIPSVAKDGDVEYTVTEISWCAFYKCTDLTSVTIPESVTTIGIMAFDECSSLTSLTIPESVTEIGVSAFSGCSGLRSVTLPTFITEIENHIFYRCSSLTSVTIPESVTTIGKSAFNGCRSLTSVTIPEAVSEIGESAFYGCSSLESVTIPNSVTSIGVQAFCNCSGLTWALIPNSVTSIGRDAFFGCSGLKKSAYPSGLSNPFGDGIAIEYPREGSIIEDGFVYGPEKTAIYFAPLSLEGDYIIPPSVTTIGNNAFAECSGLKKGAYPSGLSNPFRNGYSIEYPREGAIIEDGFVFGPEKKTIYFAPFSLEGEYVIPEFVTKIGRRAFEYCIGLTSVIIPNSVIEIGNYAFYFCSGIRKLAYPSGNFETAGIFDCETEIEYPREGAIIEDGFVFGPEKNAIYFAPLSLEGEYVIPKSVTKIGEHAFEYCTGLTSVKATPINPPVMDDNSFDGLYDTAALSVPVEGATDYLASNWTLFKDFRIGDSETSGQTYETGNLKYMLIPGKTKEDKNLAVVIPGDYSSLTEVTIPERFTVSDNGTNVRYYVDGIGCNAFKGCSNLATVTFNSRNASHIIGDYAFAQTTISELTIPETVEAIGNHAFAKCSSLTGIVIPGSVETIGDYAFSDAWKLKTVTLNEGLKSIGEKAFNSSGTTEVLNVPSTLQSIGIDAFKDFKCKNVHISDLCAWCNIDFGNAYSNPATYSKRLYLNGEMIENLVIPESVAAIKDYAFYWNRALKSVKFNEALQSIGVCAFFNCGSCTTLEIPGNVTYIDKTAFADISIKNLTFAYGPKPIVFDGVNGFSTISTRSLSCDRPLESLNLDFNNLESLTIGNSVTEIPAAKFKEASKLASLTLGNSLTTIGDEAFSGCSAITEVILPPSVETIGASAFAGSNNLTSIIMGHNVATIGEKAYDLCPAQTVSITAQTPPTAPDNTFSNYTGNLYVQGEDAVKAYYNSDFCWFQFEGHVMIEPTDLKVEGDKTLTGKPGDTFQLTARLYPEGVTLPQIFWRSTNPDIATVDANGLVTLHADLSEIMTMAEGDDSSANSCRIIAESLYADGPVAEVTVNNNQSGVDTIFDNNDPKEIDFTAPVEVYNLQGVKVATTVDHLSAGIYIVRQGKNVMKMAVK